jgi:DNA-directed RNA polymerase omega subunit
MNKNTIIDNCLSQIPHRFDLVILASQRARMLHLGAKSPLNEEGSKVELALKEIALGVCTKQSILESFNSSIEIFDEEDSSEQNFSVKDIKDGISYDDFNIEDEIDDAE